MSKDLRIPMLKRIPNIFLVLILLLSLVQCAKKGMPEGGPEDEEPPKFLRASPENYSTNFNKDEIRIFFNEYIKLENPQQQILISPPMETRPSILPMGSPRKDILIEIFDTLQENTTYTINFGKSIVDNNEGNELPYFKYVFSTGDYLDSLSVYGEIRDAYLKEPEEIVSIFLYEKDTAFTDSAVYSKTPRYVTYSKDSVHTFELENLKEGTYHMVAVQDANANYNFNPKTEKIGFVEGFIDVKPGDSSFYEISMAKEKIEFEPEPRPKLLKGNQILIGYEGTTDFDSIRINLLNPPSNDIETRITRDLETDTLYYWYNQMAETDSLAFEVVSPTRRDTLHTEITEMERDSLTISTEPGGTIEFDQDFIFRGNTPITERDESLISVRDVDSATVNFNTEFRPLENEIILKFEKEEDNSYSIQALPGAFTDLFGDTNDTIAKNVKTNPYSDYGSVILTFQNIQDFPVIVQLTDTDGEVVAEQFSNSETRFNFQYLKPGEYLVRVIYDENDNREWDTGNYLEKRQPEKIRYYRDTLEVRSNWDINEPIQLD